MTIVDGVKYVGLPKTQFSQEMGTHWEFCQVLKECVVSVCVSSKPTVRNGFHTQISVCGIFEQRSKDAQYRVVVSDGTYVYFNFVDIDCIVTKSSIIDIAEKNEIERFKDGSVAVIWIRIEQN